MKLLTILARCAPLLLSGTMSSAQVSDAPTTTMRELGTPDPAICADRIYQARQASGQPSLLQRETADPDNPILIWAVDRRQDGCSVLVTMGDPDDFRPIPVPGNETELIPAQ
ncbi:hypothetical protein [Qipengyuania marisflavi]|uniref:Uncharacterized protein n=1 Tax=Qipengyuania marisflavi TaxID=2486356 RepID=A0A5S3PAV2_9SPHN|nr:hypothetical protein [Qipengyuania marisflavi]TMM49875.1 hypothetical protein FEV51_01360 [Qipengyuania marisflavi]